MRYIVIPEDITLRTFDGEPIKDKNEEVMTMSFSYFIHGRLRDPKFGETMEGVQAVAQVLQAFKDAEKAKEPYIMLDKADWDKLCEVLKTPSKGIGYVPEVAACILPFFTAVTDAKENRPEPDPAD